MTKRPAKIAVLEWICGGGLLHIPPEQVASSLRAEGWGMLTELVRGLAAEFKVVVPLDLRLVSAADLDPRVYWIDISDPSYAPHLSPHEVLPRWAAIAEQCDAAWVIAPEIDAALPRSVDYLRGCGLQLFNSRGEFLQQCSDKRLTAKCLLVAGIPHPPTRGLEQVDEAWVNSTATTSRCETAAKYPAQPYWIVKPVAGAGGEGQRQVTRKQLWKLVHSAQAAFMGGLQSNQFSDHIVQPWMSGRPASCTAIVDSLGKRHWLPLVSQDFARPGSEHLPDGCGGDANGSGKSPPQYIGCTYPFTELLSHTPIEAPRKLLEATLDALGPGAFGPVGIDLLYDESTRTWTVIEVNARCTSSLVGLAQAYRGSLVRDIFNLLIQAEYERLADFTPSTSTPSKFSFRVNQSQ